MMYMIEQTREEKTKMYMKLTKKELVDMLINANAALDRKPFIWEIVPLPPLFIGPNNIDCATNA